MLGARDDYVRATSPLERSAKLHTADAVDEAAFAAAMRDKALDWTPAEREALAPLLPRLERFLAGMRWKRPPAVLLVKAADGLEDGLPHTRAGAIIVQERVLRSWPPPAMAYLMAHEVFHVLSRAEPELREQLYAAIGFQPCASLQIPVSLARLRITNPDAPELKHAVQVRWRGQPFETVPFVHFADAEVDPRQGFKGRIQVSWLLVERRGTSCRASAQRVARAELEGLDDQVGRNTRYLLHPEEILADNFALLFLLELRDTPPQIASPEVLERMRKILSIR